MRPEPISLIESEDKLQHPRNFFYYMPQQSRTRLSHSFNQLMAYVPQINLGESHFIIGALWPHFAKANTKIQCMIDGRPPLIAQPKSKIFQRRMSER